MAFLLFALAACGNGSTGSSNTTVPTPNSSLPTVTAPTDLVTPGTLTVGSDTTYPPQEYIDTATGKATGFDVDLITAIADRMGLKVNIVTTGFDTILDSLTAKRFDVVISAVTINPDRQKKADFVPYFNAGESLLVEKGNPKNITDINNACGLKIGVQDGTVEQTDAQAASDACTKAGKSAITLTVLKNETDVVQLLATKRVDATYQDSPVTDYYILQNPGQFQVGGSVVNAAAEGIAVRKGDSVMLTAVQTAFSQLKTSGTYDALFKKWMLDDDQKYTGTSYIERRTSATA
ncbi:MAG TPA: ABC transporter substrate-binding protein [Ktedonobacteraceae bacterium]|nr:ABC transporter substrate-binding protein [Ktedonobacteraceae bacterium]